MLRRGHTRKNQLTIEIMTEVGVTLAPIENKMRENSLRSFGHVRHQLRLKRLEE